MGWPQKATENGDISINAGTKRKKIAAGQLNYRIMVFKIEQYSDTIF